MFTQPVAQLALVLAAWGADLCERMLHGLGFDTQNIVHTCSLQGFAIHTSDSHAVFPSERFSPAAFSGHHNVQQEEGLLGPSSGMGWERREVFVLYRSTVKTWSRWRLWTRLPWEGAGNCCCLPDRTPWRITKVTHGHLEGTLCALEVRPRVECQLDSIVSISRGGFLSVGSLDLGLVSLHFFPFA